MNERQQKLKSILDRYSACTLTLEDAETELRDIFRADARDAFESMKIEAQQRPTGFVDADGNVDEYEKTSLDEPTTLRVKDLKPGVRYVECYDGNYHYWKMIPLNGDTPKILVEKTEHIVSADKITAKFGTFELAYHRADYSRWVCKLDGNDIRNVTRLDIHIGVGVAPTIKFETKAII